MSIIRAIDKLFVRSIGTLCVILFIVMIVAVLGQVVMRYLFSSPLTWSEELARYCMVWLAMLASALCSRAGLHLALINADLLSPRYATPLRLLGGLAAATILVILFWHSLDLTSRSVRQTTPGLGLSMSWVYASLPIGFGLMILGLILGLLIRQDSPVHPKDPAP